MPTHDGSTSARAPPPHDPTLRSRSSVWYQRTDYLCYTPVLSSAFSKCTSRAGGADGHLTSLVCLLDDISVNASSCHGRNRRSRPVSHGLQTVRAPHAHANLRELECGPRCPYARLSRAFHTRTGRTPRHFVRHLAAPRRSHRLIRASSYLGRQAEGRVRVAGMAGDVLPALLINGGARRCVIQALARGEGVPTVGHELDKVAALPAKDEIVQCVVGQRHRASAGVKRQWD
ncbi:hypothetical protein EDB89DRAFT_311467 [Lactarius sanguifluus]|nr:hypothetical protein EDB89DRAFT_311467 [Lactarius sanguifluus]